MCSSEKQLRDDCKFATVWREVESAVVSGEVEVFGCLGEQLGLLTVMPDLSQFSLRKFAYVKDLTLDPEWML